MQSGNCDPRELAVAGGPHGDADDPPEGTNCPHRTGREGEGPDVSVTKDRWRSGQTGAAGELRELNRTQSPPASIS